MTRSQESTPRPHQPVLVAGDGVAPGGIGGAAPT